MKVWIETNIDKNNPGFPYIAVHLLEPQEYNKAHKEWSAVEMARGWFRIRCASLDSLGFKIPTGTDLAGKKPKLVCVWKPA